MVELILNVLYHPCAFSAFYLGGSSCFLPLLLAPHPPLGVIVQMHCLCTIEIIVFVMEIAKSLTL